MLDDDNARTENSLRVSVILTAKSSWEVESSPNTDAVVVKECPKRKISRDETHDYGIDSTTRYLVNRRNLRV